MSDKREFKVAGEGRTLFMSFGLLNELSKTVGDIENIAAVLVNADMREKVLGTLLSKRDETGKIVEPYNFMTSEMTMDEANSLIDWVSEHLMGFFLRALEGATNLRQKNEPAIQKLMSSLNGSAA